MFSFYNLCVCYGGCNLYTYVCTQRKQRPAPASVVGAVPLFLRESFILEPKGLHLRKQARNSSVSPTTSQNRAYERAHIQHPQVLRTELRPHALRLAPALLKEPRPQPLPLGFNRKQELKQRLRRRRRMCVLWVINH